jgi:hypothetical protein
MQQMLAHNEIAEKDSNDEEFRNNLLHYGINPNVISQSPFAELLLRSLVQ